jgi:peptidoglycan hydrolase-like protein with peptidoglycan-binding domain
MSIIQCPLNRPTLEFGASREVVKQMQKVLNQRLAEFDALSSLPQKVSESGYFDKNTRIAVKYLQCLAFLPVDGIVAPKTWAFLCDGSASLPRLRIGTASSVVISVQQLLKDAGYYFGKVDGVFGAKTAEAVVVFQASRHLTSDGIIDPQTWNALIRTDFHIKYCRINLVSG